jgi:serine protease Do
MSMNRSCNRSRPGRETLRWLAAAVALGVVVLGPASAQAQSTTRIRWKADPPRSLTREEPPAAVQGMSIGTGFFVDGTGDMLTARHVVNDCTRIVVTKEGRSLAARLVALDPRYDLALIKVTRTLGLAAVFPQSASSVANQMVFASDYDKLGDLLKHGGAMANSMVTGEGEAGHIAMRSDITFGSSGAPVLDSRGLVAGVISRRKAGWARW